MTILDTDPMLYLKSDFLPMFHAHYDPTGTYLLVRCHTHECAAIGGVYHIDGSYPTDGRAREVLELNGWVPIPNSPGYYWCSAHGRGFRELIL